MVDAVPHRGKLSYSSLIAASAQVETDALNNVTTSCQGLQPSASAVKESKEGLCVMFAREFCILSRLRGSLPQLLAQCTEKGITQLHASSQAACA
eukprot:4380703-Amphidinium_carterae.1